MYLAFQFLQDCLDQSPPSPVVLTHQQVQEIMTFYNSHQYVFPLKIYSGYSILMGFEEGACLIFAPNRREAKKLAFKQLKGWYDDKSKTKIRRFGKYFPEEKLVLIDATWFRKNGRTLSSIIKDWEKDRI